jgi:hypothetical protein
MSSFYNRIQVCILKNEVFISYHQSLYIFIVSSMHLKSSVYILISSIYILNPSLYIRMSVLSFKSLYFNIKSLYFNIKSLYFSIKSLYLKNSLYTDKRREREEGRATRVEKEGRATRDARRERKEGRKTRRAMRVGSRSDMEDA